MPRRVEDILPNDRRSIKEIPVRPNGREKVPKARSDDDDFEEVPIHIVSEAKFLNAEKKAKPVKAKKHHRSGIWNKIIYFIVGIIVLSAIAYFASAYFSRAVFTISPRSIPVNINSSYVATDTGKDGLLSYKIIKLEGVASSTVIAKDGPSISAKAQGTITIYNAYSPTARRLIAGTRFSSPNGNIYKLSNSIMIPGYKKSSTGTIIPGSIKSTIVASEVGSEYNIDGTKVSKPFKIVAYVGDDKYNKIYGELTGVIKGGASGTKKIIDPLIQASTTAYLQNKVSSDLISKMNTSVSSSTFMFDKTFVNYESQVSDASTGKANIIVRGTAYGILFNKKELITKLVGTSIVDSFDGFAFDAVGLDKLSFVISNLKDYKPEKGGTLIMQLKGGLTLVGVVPINELLMKFAGRPLSETAEILHDYSPIIDLTKSLGQVVPPWSKVPKDVDKISIIMGK